MLIVYGVTCFLVLQTRWTPDHIHNTIWTAIVAEQLPCAREVGNAKDRYAIFVLQGLNVVEYISQKISKICSLFLLQGGTITYIGWNIMQHIFITRHGWFNYCDRIQTQKLSPHGKNWLDGIVLQYNRTGEELATTYELKNSEVSDIMCWQPLYLLNGQMDKRKKYPSTTWTWNTGYSLRLTVVSRVAKKNAHMMTTKSINA